VVAAEGCLLILKREMLENQDLVRVIADLKSKGTKMVKQASRREFVKKAAYVAPVVVTLAVAPSYAKAGSQKVTPKPPKPPKLPVRPAK
jgi:hypothetical protein